MVCIVAFLEREMTSLTTTQLTREERRPVTAISLP